MSSRQTLTPWGQNTQPTSKLLENQEFTQVTDAGLEHLKGLTSLRSLQLHRIQVTDEGVKKLQQALPKCWIEH